MVPRVLFLICISFISSRCFSQNTKGLYINFNLLGYSPPVTVEQEPGTQGSQFPTTKLKGGYMFGIHFGYGIKQWLTVYAGGDFASANPDTYTSGSIDYLGGGVRFNHPKEMKTRPYAVIEYGSRSLSLTDSHTSGNTIYIYGNTIVTDYNFSYGVGLHTKFLDFGYKYSRIDFTDQDPSISPFTTHRLFIGVTVWVKMGKK